MGASGMLQEMFHIEVRERSHRLSRLNMTEQELASTVLVPWVRGERIELGERTWRPEEASIRIVEGPEIPIGAMTLGRGWPTAVREGREVTQALIAAAGRQFAAGAAPGGEPSGPPPGGGPSAMAASAAAEAGLLADSLGLELLRRLSDGAIGLHEIWKVSAERHPQLSASASLEIASRALASLFGSKLIVAAHGVASGSGEPMSESELQAALGDIDSWSEGETAGTVWISRA